MPLPKPTLDNRSFDQLVAESVERCSARGAPGVDRPQRVRPRHHAARARRLACRTEHLSLRPPVRRGAGAPSCAWSASNRSRPGVAHHGGRDRQSRRRGDRSAGAHAARHSARTRCSRRPTRCVVSPARLRACRGRRPGRRWTDASNDARDRVRSPSARGRGRARRYTRLRSRARRPGRDAGACTAGPTTGSATRRPRCAAGRSMNGLRGRRRARSPDWRRHYRVRTVWEYAPAAAMAGRSPMSSTRHAR